jgi:hypothetical protein
MSFSILHLLIMTRKEVLTGDSKAMPRWLHRSFYNIFTY